MVQSDLQKYSLLTKQHTPYIKIILSGGLQRNKKIGKTVTLYRREMLEKKSSLIKYNTQSAIKGLKTAIM
jgi:hypothetical protein